MYDDVKKVLYQSNGVFVKKEDMEINPNKSLRLGKRVSSFEKSRAAEKYMSESKDIKARTNIYSKHEPSNSNNPKSNVYKTLLKSSKYSCAKPVEK